jgi:MbtH protein
MTETETFRVVRNAEDQHSIWQTHLPIPLGWEDAGFVGSREECLRHIQQVWTDITPKSARRPTGA